MIHGIDLTICVCLLVCKQRIPRATRESFNNLGDHGQVSLTMRNLGVNEPDQYTVSTKDGRMMIDAKGWSWFKSKSYLAVGDDVKIKLSRQGEFVQINFEILQWQHATAELIYPLRDFDVIIWHGETSVLRV